MTTLGDYLKYLADLEEANWAQCKADRKTKGLDPPDPESDPEFTGCEQCCPLFGKCTLTR